MLDGSRGHAQKASEPDLCQARFQSFGFQFLGGQASVPSAHLVAPASVVNFFETSVRSPRPFWQLT